MLGEYQRAAQSEKDLGSFSSVLPIPSMHFHLGLSHHSHKMAVAPPDILSELLRKRGKSKGERTMPHDSVAPFYCKN